MIDSMILEYPIPYQAASVLKRVQTLVPSAIIAGGCLRDAINGRTINDIDVFVPVSTLSLVREALAETHPELTKSIPEPYFTFNNDVRSVQYYGGKGLPVNVIGVTADMCNPEDQLARFDFGICKVAYDGVRLWKDLAFDRDQRDQTFTLLPYQTPEQREYSMQRYARLTSDKYAGWKLVDATPKPHVFGDL